MPITQAPRIVRVSFIHNMRIGPVVEDQAEFSVCFQAGALPPDPGTLNAVLQDMSNAAYASYVTNVDPSSFSTAVELQKVRVALEDIDGHTLAERFTVFGGAYEWSGTSGANCLPWNTSLAISLYAYEPGTFDTFGKSKRGRFYLPPTHSNLLAGDGSGEFTSGATTFLRDEYAQILKELAQHAYTGFPTFAPELVINSRKYAEAFPVGWIRADSKVDSQRRRYNREPAAVYYTAWPSP